MHTAPSSDPIIPPRPPPIGVPPKATPAKAMSAYSVLSAAEEVCRSAVSAIPPAAANRPPSA